MFAVSSIVSKVLAKIIGGQLQENVLDVGVQGKTFVIFAIGVHSHDGQHSANITRTFTLAQEIVAKAYVSNNTTWSNVGLTNAFRVAGFDLQMLPASDRRSRWLIDHKPRTTSVSRDSMDQWPENETAQVVDLFFGNRPSSACEQFSRYGHGTMCGSEAIVWGSRVEYPYS